MKANDAYGASAYRPTARLLHWLMAVLIFYQLLAGVMMTYEGEEGNLVERIANALHMYDMHKVLGLVLLTLVAVRIAYRLLAGAPADEPTLEVWQRETSHMVHAWIYFLLVAVPVLGWVGISLYPAVRVFESFNLPALTGADKATSEVIMKVHGYAALTLASLIAMHIGAALFHHFIRRDGVLRRMLPGLTPPDQRT